MKSIDHCAVTNIKEITGLLPAGTVVRLPAPIVVKIRGRDSLVVRLLRKSNRKHNS